MGTRPCRIAQQQRDACSVHTDSAGRKKERGEEDREHFLFWHPGHPGHPATSRPNIKLGPNPGIGVVENPEGGDLYLSLALQPAWRWSKDLPARSRKIPGTRPNP